MDLAGGFASRTEPAKSYRSVARVALALFTLVGDDSAASAGTTR
jgi:hypothetical protein